jgi:hypothetical protein
MTAIEREARRVLRGYQRRGGKKYREQQVDRALVFCAHAHGMGARHLGQIGHEHVMAFWERMAASGRTGRTLDAYWDAIYHLIHRARQFGILRRDHPDPPRPPHGRRGQASRTQESSVTPHDTPPR